MERGSITKWLFVALAIFLVIQYAPKALWPKKAGDHPAWSIRDEATAPAESRPAEETCTIDAPRFKAELSTRGASLRHLTLKDYTQPMAMPGGTLAGIKHLILGDGKTSKVPMDLVSTTREGRS